MTDLVAYTTDEAMTMEVTGYAPNSFFAHRFGDGKDERTMLDPNMFSSLKLKVTNGAAGGAGSVVLQQLCK